ncbi:ANTAR domain-containing protein [Pseudokineococcus lusitanus]|uniref:ANTAR domain-containing protein n=1 Tax=Pseudokineococcus lusitanus TaxID=763993 RepID=A0A3N1GWY0_9ACTN|nr:ANTAR domain-containing protein [Pseudokineococcus lusitanus]ROP34793.1 ANTAR domain-containing protein [Pseudokineococcus lusitanus]
MTGPPRQRPSSEVPAAPEGPDDVSAGGQLAVLADLARLVLDLPGLAGPGEVVDLVARALPGVLGVSITLVEAGVPRQAASSSPPADVLDRHQRETGVGPGLDAALTGAVVRVLTGDDPVYADFSAAAARVGVTAVVAVGLPLRPQVVGSLTVYGTGRRLGEPGTLVLVRTVAAYAAIALAGRLDAAERRADSLRSALEARAVVEQATGVLMARHDLGAEEALLLLVRTSQDTDVKLRAVAADVLDRARRGEPV